MMTNSNGTLVVAALAASLLAGCGAPTSSVPATAGAAHDAHRASGPVPPACTVPKVQSGAKVTSITAYGNVVRRGFKLLPGPSSWMQVQWLSTPPPGKHRATLPATRPRDTGHYNLYFGTYKLSDRTMGCFYLVESVGGKPIGGNGNAAITALPRIPSTGATLPLDFGEVHALQVTLHADDTGGGNVILDHYNGNPAMGGAIQIIGKVSQ
jgi:hypothetical protein